MDNDEVRPKSAQSAFSALKWHMTPKRVVSVSLGSSSRNASAELEVLGQPFVLERIGTDGSMQKAAQLLSELDGKVAAFGLGGTDLQIVAGDRRYAFKDIQKLAAHAKITPIVDGGGLKHTLERMAVAQLEPVVGWQGRKTLMVSAVDRFGMAQALDQAGADMVYGDIIYGVGLDFPIRSLPALERTAHLVLPVITNLPFEWFYPTGAKQESAVRDWRKKYYDWAEVVAGDTHYVKRYAPENLSGKTFLTQTITSADVEAFKKAGLKRLIATTPKLNGRNFGNNVMEAFFVALAGKNRSLTPQEYTEYIQQLEFVPEVYDLA
jgi:hypothetical protein